MCTYRLYQLNYFDYVREYNDILNEGETRYTCSLRLGQPKPGLMNDKYLFCAKCFQESDRPSMQVTDEHLSMGAYAK